MSEDCHFSNVDFSLQGSHALNYALIKYLFLSDSSGNGRLEMSDLDGFMKVSGNVFTFISSYMHRCAENHFVTACNFASVPFYISNPNVDECVPVCAFVAYAAWYQTPLAYVKTEVQHKSISLVLQHSSIAQLASTCMLLFSVVVVLAAVILFGAQTCSTDLHA